MRQLIDDVYAIEGLKVGRSYLIAERDGIVLIDTSTKSAAAGIIAEIESIGRRPEELRAIVATHYHHDHTGNITALVEQTGAQVYAHADDAPYVQANEPWMQPKGFLGGLIARGAPEQTPINVDHILNEGDELPFAGGLRVLHTPGHTPGSISLYSPAREMLLCGDALMNVFGLRLPPSMSSHDMDQARQSIARIAELQFEHALPGHGAPILSHASEKIRAWSRGWL